MTEVSAAEFPDAARAAAISDSEMPPNAKAPTCMNSRRVFGLGQFLVLIPAVFILPVYEDQQSPARFHFAVHFSQLQPKG